MQVYEASINELETVQLPYGRYKAPTYPNFLYKYIYNQKGTLDLT